MTYIHAHIYTKMHMHTCPHVHTLSPRGIKLNDNFHPEKDHIICCPQQDTLWYELNDLTLTIAKIQME